MAERCRPRALPRPLGPHEVIELRFFRESLAIFPITDNRSLISSLSVTLAPFNRRYRRVINLATIIIPADPKGNVPVVRHLPQVYFSKRR